MNRLKKARNALTKKLGFKPASKNGRHAWIISTVAEDSNSQRYAIVLGTDPKLPGLFHLQVACYSDDANEQTRQEIETDLMTTLTKAFGKLYQVENPTPPSIH